MIVCVILLGLEGSGKGHPKSQIYKEFIQIGEKIGQDTLDEDDRFWNAIYALIWGLVTPCWFTIKAYYIRSFFYLKGLPIIPCMEVPFIFIQKLLAYHQFSL